MIEKKLRKVLVTGGAGFIGFHLARALKKQGDVVFSIDNFEPYYNPKLKKKRAQYLKAEGILLFSLDICDKEKLDKAITEISPTHIVHLAAQAGVRHSISNPQRYLEVNIQGFFNILETIRKFPKIKLIYGSSSSVYGYNKKIPFSEEDMVNDPPNFYAATKLSNESMARCYHNLFDITAIGLRFFTVYGPWGRPDMAYYSFADAISQDLPISLFNNGNMSRDFTFIDDIVAGVISAIDYAHGYNIFNLGRGKTEQLEHFVSCISKELGKKAIIKLLPLQPGEVVATCADISKAEKLLGYSPKVNIEEGIARFVQWYQKAQGIALC